MFGSQVLETAVGLVFFFLSLSILVTAIQEFIATALRLRAKSLNAGISDLLELQKNLDPVIQTIILHPRISPPDKKLSYLSSQGFASTVVHVLSGAGDASQTQFERLNLAIHQLPDGRFKKILLLAVDRANHDLKVVEQEIAEWFDESMDHVAGQFKRFSSYLSFALGGILAFGLNLNALAVCNALWQSPVLRAQAIAAASVAQAPSVMTTASSDQVLKMFGFQYFFISFPTGITLLGCLITAFAISMGAPFWFDFLQNILKLNVRGTGDKPARYDSP
ncbi:hypothetical protein AAKU64_003833 [Undibacterium sp. GrIS 1.8]|uniref:hypothetical protein n=1 Tax=unclassified Undibacterium TaxID=2630295 RepID=UPI003394E4F7